VKRGPTSWSEARTAESRDGVGFFGRGSKPLPHQLNDLGVGSEAKLPENMVLVHFRGLKVEESGKLNISQ